jgi:hypothetical protein
MHARKRETRVTGTGGVDKAVVLGMLERGDADNASRVRAQMIKDPNAATLQREVRENVNKGSMVVTDGLPAYRGLERDYLHQYVDHASEFVRGIVHTNGIENFWSLLKRSIKGTYVSVEPFHLDAYVTEQAFRFNERRDNDAGRFQKVLSSVVGKRLTYQDLITHGAPEGAH